MFITASPLLAPHTLVLHRPPLPDRTASLRESHFSAVGRGSLWADGKQEQVGCFDSLLRAPHAHTLQAGGRGGGALTVCANINADWDCEGRVAVRLVSGEQGGARGGCDVQINGCAGQAGTKWPSVYTCDGEASSLPCGC